MKLPRIKTNNSKDKYLNMVRRPPRKEVKHLRTKEVLKDKVCRLCGKKEPEVSFNLGRPYNPRDNYSGGVHFDKRCKSCKRVERQARYRRNKDKENALTKEHWKNNKELYKLRKKIRMRDDPDFAFRMALSGHNKRLYLDGIKRETFDEILGCTINEAIEHFEQKFQPGMSWENHGQWHIDHIRPLASFDLTDPEQRKQAGHYSNLQPLWAKENLSKGCRYDPDSV
jgi:hypothetical protein